jgi:hypothetical protein
MWTNFSFDSFYGLGLPVKMQPASFLVVSRAGLIVPSHDSWILRHPSLAPGD